MKLEDGLIATDALAKQGGAMLIKNSGKIIAAMTILVAVLLTFTDVSFATLGSRTFTTTLTVMLVSSYLIYFSLEDSGEKLGEESEDYLSGFAAYEKVRALISGEDIGALRDFCTDYSKKELEFRRRAYLVSHGCTEEELLSFCRGEQTPRELKRYLRRAAKMKAVPLTPAMLLGGDGNGRRSELADRTRFKTLRMAVKLLPTMVFTCVTVSVILTLKDGLSAATVIESIVKLSSLPVIGFRGYAAGYSHVKNAVLPRIDTRRRLLEAYIGERNAR